jgi:hypothetical protein
LCAISWSRFSAAFPVRSLVLPTMSRESGVLACGGFAGLACQSSQGGVHGPRPTVGCRVCVEWGFTKSMVCPFFGVCNYTIVGLNACCLSSVTFRYWASGIWERRGLWGSSSSYVSRKGRGIRVGPRAASRRPDFTVFPAHSACASCGRTAFPRPAFIFP